MKCSGMFYSLETNQNEITMSSSLGGNQNSNLYWKTWDLCLVSKLCLVCSKKAWNLVFACSGKLSSVLNEMFRHVLLSGD